MAGMQRRIQRARQKSLPTRRKSRSKNISHLVLPTFDERKDDKEGKEEKKKKYHQALQVDFSDFLRFFSSRLLLDFFFLSSPSPPS